MEEGNRAKGGVRVKEGKETGWKAGQGRVTLTGEGNGVKRGKKCEKGDG